MANQRLQTDYQFGPFQLTSDQLLRQNSPVLSDTLLKLCRYLFDRRGQWIETNDVEQYLYARKSSINRKGCVHTAIGRLRVALGESWEGLPFIETRRKGGHAYRFNPAIKVIPVRTSVQQPHVDITRPHAEEHVGRIITIQGEADELPANTELWLVVEGRRFHPNSSIEVRERAFQATAYVGAEGEDRGVRFILHIVACSPETAAAYRDYVKTSKARDTWHGVTSLSGGRIVATVPVIRDDGFSA